MRWLKLLITTLGVATTLGATDLPSRPRDISTARPTLFSGELSVLTYNVQGLPWPLVWGRPADFLHIADRLRDLGTQGRRPQVVLLQEAFTEDARRIGAEAGYPYIANGPDAGRISAAKPTHIEAGFLSGASWSKGEDLGKALGSGLQILSDYPIVRTRVMAFPAFACAGYDCLANKGALMVSIRLPGTAGVVDVVTTHFNSRGRSGVGDDRSDQAYRLQAESLSSFIRANHDPRHPLIVAGDFNIGTSTFRRMELVGRTRLSWTGVGDVQNVYDEAVRRRLPLSADAELSRKKAKDWQFFASGQQSDIDLRRVDVPFGHDRAGNMLSDHIGYTAVFEVKAAPRVQADPDHGRGFPGLHIKSAQRSPADSEA